MVLTVRYKHGQDTPLTVMVGEGPLARECPL